MFICIHPGLETIANWLTKTDEKSFISDESVNLLTRTTNMVLMNVRKWFPIYRISLTEKNNPKSFYFIATKMLL